MLEDLLHLELAGVLDLGDLLREGSIVRDGRRELTHLAELRTRDTRDLTNERVRRDEGVIFLGPLLDDLLVLLEGLQTFDVNEGHGLLLTLVDVLLIGNDHDADLGLARVGEDDGTTETLITGRIVVLETNLELDGLQEIALLGFEGVLEEGIDLLGESILGKFAHSDYLLGLATID